MRFVLILTCLLFLFSCVSNILNDKLVLSSVSFKELPGWNNDNHDEALVSFLKSCQKFKEMPQNRFLINNKLGGKFKDWKLACERAPMAHYRGQRAAKDFFEAHFEPFAATSWGKSEGLFTGYFEIGLKGSREKRAPYLYPLYKRPKDLLKGVPYYSHKEINKGALNNKNLELIWVSDPVRRFFLHVQGSGVVDLDDGSRIRVGYDGKNNHQYRSIGRYMIERGILEKEYVSAKSIKNWLYSNPDKMWRLMEHNPSYVFFREIDGDGPIGAQDVPLTPLRSLAVDKSKIPYGVPTWLDVELNAEIDPIKRRFQRLLIAQDTGSAIKGAVRGDIFFGAGHKAETLAGYQNNKGRYYVLLPKGISLNE